MLFHICVEGIYGNYDIDLTLCTCTYHYLVLLSARAHCGGLVGGKHQISASCEGASR
jgi:hypothetical protein